MSLTAVPEPVYSRLTTVRKASFRTQGILLSMQKREIQSEETSKMRVTDIHEVECQEKTRAPMARSRERTY